MGIKKTLGGDRLGSGNRMKQEMHDFYRSNKNLSTVRGSTMAPGVLYPMYTNVALKGDTFDIDVNAFVRTIPTEGPLYGSFKLQVDFFQVPFRLYQAILHNNTTDIARKMNQVYLPKIKIGANVKRTELLSGLEEQIDPSALLRYTDLSGLGRPIFQGDVTEREITREVLALPTLAYYDIFKNYYANKQEEEAYVIKPKVVSFLMQTLTASNTYNFEFTDNNLTIIPQNEAPDSPIFVIDFVGQNVDTSKVKIAITFNDFNLPITRSLDEWNETDTLSVYFTGSNKFDIDFDIDIYKTITKIEISAPTEIETKLNLESFPLSNIDDMRKYLLTQWDLGAKVVISKDNQNYLPYSAITGKTEAGTYNNKYAMNGLVVKTYQSDMFNNWLDTEWVNEITDASSIDTTSGSFTLDLLNFKKKLYDHLNRLAISGGTYDDWQEATYGDKVWGKAEKPIYCGGMSSEVYFEEVVSTAATEQDVLGTIGGRGTLAKRKGGNITIKVGEASIIMAIVSLTPRIMYSQGNAWFNTEIDTMDDLHKPIFDRIGFQDLITEQMAWFGTIIDPSNGLIRTSAGKQPAWMQYATDVDRVYGDFARKEGTSFMVLNRNYEQSENGGIKDVTTYIDPSKYNYAFAYSELDAQNFWTFLNLKIKARRKMSNTQIPNV